MTKIERTEKTWNPIVGCSIVSPGCTRCYAMRMAARLEAMAEAENARRTDPHHGGKTFDSPLSHYLGTTQPSKAGPVWTGKVALAPDRVICEPLRRRKPTMWFVNSMGDLFHENVPDEWIDRVFAVMALTPQHTYQLLTKRSARMRAYMLRADDEHGDYFERLSDAAVDLTDSPCAAHVDSCDWPLPNVWLGVSAERQQEADERIPDLLATPAAVRFVSCEPLLAPVDIGSALQWQGTGTRHDGTVAPFGVATEGPDYDPDAPQLASFDGPYVRLNWVICGGESGPGARPLHPDWARSLRDQCASAGVPFFFKQVGEWLQAYDRDVDDPDWRRCDQVAAETPNGQWLNLAGGQGFHGDRVVRIARVGKARAGRLLDGVLHDAMPSR